MQQQFKDRSFWQEVCPDLTVAADKSRDLAAARTTLSEGHLSDASDTMDNGGYLSLPKVFDGDDIARCRTGIELLVDRGIPAPFIYMFEEPWALFAGASELIEHFLGQGYRVLPHLWAWHIAPDRGNRGWPLHRDSEDSTIVDHGGIAQLVSLSLWLPLSDAPDDGACMNVLPLDRSAPYRPAPQSVDAIDPEDLKALPAKAGDILGWRQDVYHWSSAFRSGRTTPRISLSFEFQNPMFDALAEPLLDPFRPPGFQERLQLIRDQFEKYRHIEGENERFSPS